MPDMRRSLAACIRKISSVGRKVFLKSKKSASTPSSPIFHSSITPESKKSAYTPSLPIVLSSTTPETSPSSSPPTCTPLDNQDIVHDFFLSSQPDITPETSRAPSPAPTSVSHNDEIQPTTHTTVDQPLLLHGINKLPPEIFLRILVMAVEETRRTIIHKHGGVTPKTYSDPLAFARVSKEWRAIATAERSLWTTIAVRPSRKTCEGVCDGIAKWIANSGNSTRLSIFLNMDKLNWQPSDAFMRRIPAEPYDVTESYLGPYFALMKQNQHRWDAVGLHVPYPTLADLLPFDTTGIRYFLVRPLASTERFPINVLEKQWPNCLRPTHLVHFYEERIPTTFAFNNIVRLELPNWGMSIDFALSLLLLSCASLELCEIRVYGALRTSQYPAVIRLGRLTTFRIQAARASTITTILDCLETPRLANATLDMCSLVPLPSLRGLLSRSRYPKIQKLDLRCRGFHPANDLLAFLDSYPSLLHLNLAIHKSKFDAIAYIPTVTEAFLLRLARPQNPENDSVVLPNLQSLTYRGPQDFRWEYLLLMCHRRLRPQSQLAVYPMDLIEIHIDDDVDADGVHETQFHSAMDTKTCFGLLELCETRRNGKLTIILPDQTRRADWQSKPLTCIHCNPYRWH